MNADTHWKSGSATYPTPALFDWEYGGYCRRPNQNFSLGAGTKFWYGWGKATLCRHIQHADRFVMGEGEGWWRLPVAALSPQQHHLLCWSFSNVAWDCMANVLIGATHPIRWLHTWTFSMKNCFIFGIFYDLWYFLFFSLPENCDLLHQIFRFNIYMKINMVYSSKTKNHL